ncbi:MAG: nuclear transport factor 2 family protein [Myxococcota bacterium]
MDIRAAESELNAMILKGQGMEAFEKFYADNVVMQENRQDPRKGKDACRTYEQEFFGAVAEFHGAELHHSAVDGDRSYSEWTFDVTFKDGKRMTNTQIAARTWKDGRVVFERFFYEPNIA